MDTQTVWHELGHGFGMVRANNEAHEYLRRPIQKNDIVGSI